jgi:hypothetical protein
MLEIESFLLLAGSFGTGYSIEKTGDTVFIFIGNTSVSSGLNELVSWIT